MTPLSRFVCVCVCVCISCWQQRQHNIKICRPKEDRMHYCALNKTHCSPVFLLSSCKGQQQLSGIDFECFIFGVWKCVHGYSGCRPCGVCMCMWMEAADLTGQGWLAEYCIKNNALITHLLNYKFLHKSILLWKWHYIRNLATIWL